MPETASLTGRFQASRPRLRSLAYRILGSIADSEDALQDAWLRLARLEPARAEEIANLDGWLTTVVARTCLNKLRARRARPEEPAGVALPDLFVTEPEGSGPEQHMLLAEQVGLALQVVLDALTPPERVAFVLHDLFDLPFDEIAGLLGRSPDSARQLASRGRRRVRSVGSSLSDSDPSAERQVVDAFFAAARNSDIGGLLAVLHPDVVFRADGGIEKPQATAMIRGAADVAGRAVAFAIPGAVLEPVRVNGAPGVIVHRTNELLHLMAFTVAMGRITEIYALLDTHRVRLLLGQATSPGRMH